MAGFLLLSALVNQKSFNMKKILFPVLIVIALIFSSCSNRNQTSMMKSVTGKAGEMVIVIAPQKWEAEPGQRLIAILGQPQLSLPQDEPIFDLINIPHEAFGDIFRTSRNLVIVKVDKKIEAPKVVFRRDVHAYTQAVLFIDATTNDEAVQLINSNADKMVAFFLRAERDRLQLNYSKYHDKGVSTLIEERLGVSINVPPGFKVIENKNDFIWIRYETPEISQGIFLYTYPYEDDSTFTDNYMVAKRNIALRNNVPGPTVGSYMTTEMELPLIYNIFKHGGNYSAEARGLWRVENDFMGGPFVSISKLDLLNNRVLVLDAYVYAPSKDKRNYLRQVEAMIYSSAFINQDDIDKLNAQFEL